MPKPIIMPKFEMAQESGKVAHWLKRAGDLVSKGEAILEVETDKINMELEAPASGTLMAITAHAGESVPIGTVIAQILLPGEAMPAAAAPTVPPVAPVANAPDEPAPRLTPVARRMATTHGLDPHTLQANGGRITKSAVAQRLQPPSPAETASPAQVRAVPAARRLARELGVDLQQVAGTGPDGRIQSSDVQLAATSTPAVALPAPVSSVPTEPLAPAPPLRDDQPAIRRRVPLTAMRRTIAERLTTSWRDIPQFTVRMDVEMTRAQQVIDEVRSVLGDGPRVTLTALLVKACGWALARHPQINASYQPDGVVEWADINIGVAVAVAAGLVVPVIRQVDRLPLLSIATELQTLGERAHAGKLTPADLRSGTFTISNLGMLGVESFTAIINPPQAAILAVGKTVKRLVVTEDDQTVIKPLATFTLTADHRVVDGANAAHFLAAVRQAVEKPGVLL